MRHECARPVDETRRLPGFDGGEEEAGRRVVEGGDAYPRSSRYARDKGPTDRAVALLQRSRVPSPVDRRGIDDTRKPTEGGETRERSSGHETVRSFDPGGAVRARRLWRVTALPLSTRGASQHEKRRRALKRRDARRLCAAAAAAAAAPLPIRAYSRLPSTTRCATPTVANERSNGRNPSHVSMDAGTDRSIRRAAGRARDRREPVVT